MLVLENNLNPILQKAADMIQEAIRNGRTPYTYSEYPDYSLSKTGLPFFTSHSGISRSGPKHFSSLLGDKPTKFRESEEWTEFVRSSLADPHVKRFVRVGADESENTAWMQEQNLWIIVSEILDYCASRGLRFFLKPDRFLFAKQALLHTITSEKLPVQVIFPLAGVTFDFDSLKFGEGIVLKRIPHDLQLARNNTYADDQRHVRHYGAATHAVQFDGYSVSNERNLWGIATVLTNEKAFSEVITKAQKLLAAIHLTTEESLGLCQLVAVPIGWGVGYKGPISDVYRVDLRLYSQGEGVTWLSEKKLTRVALQKTRRTFNKMMKTSDKALDFAIDRLNDYRLRKTDRDKVMDLVSALECLLCPDSHSEITYRLSMRLTILNEKFRVFDMQSVDLQRRVKKLYEYRSAVVHGASKDVEKKRLLKIPESKPIDLVEFAELLLRRTVSLFIRLRKVPTMSEIDSLKVN